jgi:hypothetical protein
MTDIDPKSDIELHTVNEHVIARVPLAGPVTEEWLRCYQRLARATEVPVQIQGRPDRAWIVVRVPASGNQRDVAATMDAARALIAEADAAQRIPATAQAEGIVRDWWARGRETAARRPISKVETVRTGIGVEKRLVTDLIEGGPETNSASDLLSVGFGVWLYTILAFAFLYWVLDSGGPDARLWAPPEFPNLAFPEQLNPPAGLRRQ